MASYYTEKQAGIPTKQTLQREKAKYRILIDDSRREYYVDRKEWDALKTKSDKLRIVSPVYIVLVGAYNTSAEQYADDDDKGFTVPDNETILSLKMKSRSKQRNADEYRVRIENVYRFGYRVVASCDVVFLEENRIL